MPESMMKERGRRIAFPRREVQILESLRTSGHSKLRVKCVPIEGTDEVCRFVGVEMRYHLVRPNGNLDPGDVERVQPLPGSPYPWGDRRREAL